MSKTSPIRNSILEERSGCFVVQKHAARSLHFDLRLEIGGVMKSWAVPKGPSMRTTVRRLAIQVDDHPLEFNSFEGMIPPGRYGAGTIIVWDQGTYVLREGSCLNPSGVTAACETGRIELILRGVRLQGAFSLARFRRTGTDEWLLTKLPDEFADPEYDAVETLFASVRSGRTIEQLRKAISQG